MIDGHAMGLHEGEQLLAFAIGQLRPPAPVRIRDGFTESGGIGFGLTKKTAESAELSFGIFQ